MAAALRMKCGCPFRLDESESVFGRKAAAEGDWAYCPKHGDVRAVAAREAGTRRRAAREKGKRRPGKN
jgi:hypothetical protein